MKLPQIVTLRYVPSQADIDARIVALTDAMIRERMNDAWWEDPALDPGLTENEIDREWDWLSLEIERDGEILDSRKLAIVTADDAVQGAMLVSTQGVPCERKHERDTLALFVELLFAAPSNRQWIRNDRAEQFRGVGLYLLRAAAQLSREAGFGGRLKLESSPGFVEWYRKRGLLEVSSKRILHEGVKYTPMELETDRVEILLPN
jgi:hypothetical protein